MINNMSMLAVRIEISSRIKQYRIDYPMTQKELAEKTGISVRSITRFEAGEDIQFGNLIKILCALGLGDNIELLVPDPKARPSFYLAEGTLRKRASSIRERKEDRVSWKWGDES